jgi:tetratricopeptide (TPR) repeat protein
VLRGWIAGASASCAAYLAAAAIDWVWELAAISVAFLFLAGALLAARESAGAAVGGDAAAPGSPRPGWRGPVAATGISRVALGLAAVIALVAIAIPLGAYSAIDSSEQSVAADELDEALDESQAAARLQPYAATPTIQEAIVLELLGEVDAAAERAREATRQESTNWQTWLVLSRLEAKRDNPRDALRAYQRAKSLNPESPLFAG